MKLASTLPKTIVKAALAADAKHPNRIAEIDDERDFSSNAPYWIYTAKGFCASDNPSCHTITAYDVKEAVSAIKTGIVPCTCNECTDKGTNYQE